MCCRKDTLRILLPIVIQASSARGFLSPCTRPKSLKFLVICKVIIVFIQKGLNCFLCGGCREFKHPKVWYIFLLLILSCFIYLLLCSPNLHKLWLEKFYCDVYTIASMKNLGSKSKSSAIWVDNAYVCFNFYIII